MAFSDERDLSFIFSPLIVAKGIDVVGNVPATQEYDPATGNYTPDYTMTNLVLQPWFRVTDPDGVLASGRVEIANPAWSVVENGTKTAITSSNTSYAVTASGADAGKLIIKRNATTAAPLTFIFTGEYADPRTGKLYRMEMSQAVDATSTGADVRFALDLPKMVRYDPVRDTTTKRTVHTSFTAGGAAIPAANRKFVWHKKDAGDTTYHVAGSTILDYDVEVAADGSSIDVDLTLIGQRIDLRCYAFYNPYGAVTDTTIKPDTRYAEITFLRHKGAYKVKCKAFRLFGQDVKQLDVECDISDAKGIIPNPDAHFRTVWKTSQGKADGSVSYGSVLGRGASTRIPVTAMSAKYGGTLRAEATPKPPLSAIRQTAGGNILVDNSGKIIVTDTY